MGAIINSPAEPACILCALKPQQNYCCDLTENQESYAVTAELVGAALPLQAALSQRSSSFIWKK